MAILILGAALRIAGLGAKSLWLDEAISARLAAMSLPQLLTTARSYFGGLAYYLELHAWTRLFGQSETALRLLSALPSILSVALLYLVARRALGVRAGLAAALLLALSPFDIWYAQEARMYAQAAFLALVCLYAYQRCQTRRNPWWLILYALAGIAGMYTLYSFALILLLLNLHLVAIWVWQKTRPPSWIAWVTAQVAIAIAFLPWWGVFGGHVRLVLGDASRWQALVGLSRLLGRLGLPQGAVWWALGLTATLGALAFLALLWWGARHGDAAASWARRPAVAPIWGLLPLLAVTGLAIWRPNSSIRQALILLPGLALASAAALSLLGGARHWLLAALLLISVAGIAKDQFLTPKEGWRGVAQYLAAEAQPGDLILVHAYYTLPALDYYYRGVATVAPIPQRNRLAELSRLTQGRARIWLVLSHEEYEDPSGTVEGWFQSRGKPSHVGAWPGVRVELYSLIALAGQ